MKSSAPKMRHLTTVLIETGLRVGDSCQLVFNLTTDDSGTNRTPTSSTAVDRVPGEAID